MTILTMRITRLAVAMLLLVARAASAQNHGAFPTPTPAVCTLCSGTSAGLKLWPFGAPIQSFPGRFVDSTVTQDITQPVRTIRAGGVFPAPEQNRLYMILGSTVAGYTLSSFFDSKLPQGVSYVPVARYSSPSEQWLSPEFKFYAEDTTSSGWTVSVVHSQTAIGDNIDYDDRGLVYVPYAAFGWGIFDSNLRSVVQVLDGDTVTPEKILAVRSGPRYYAIVSDARSHTAIYDVSAPASSSTNELGMIAPALVSLSKATSPDGNNVVGAVTAEGKVIIATPANLALGAGPSQTFTVTYPYQYSSIVSDGTNFYATKTSSERRPMTVSVFAPNGSGSYTETAHEFPGALYQGSLRYGAGYLTIAGPEVVDNVSDVRLLKLENGVPRDVPLSGYFRNFYTAPQQGYVRTPGYLLVRDAVVYRQGNRDYLFYSAHGLGDIYELVGGDSIRVERVSTSGHGTPNPYSRGVGQGPFYGDPVTFSATPTNPATSIVWDMGNPEAGALANKPSGSLVTHQYAGLADASVATAKTVTASSTTDAAVTDSTSVTLLNPRAEVRLKGASTPLEPSATSLSFLPTDEFVDASDGSVESHYSDWTISGELIPKSAPGVPLRVGGVLAGGECGLRTMSMEAHYVPYVPAVASVPHVIRSAGPVSYTVRPFIADFRIASSNGSEIVFESTTRAASGAVSGEIALEWKLLNESTVVNTGTGASFSISKSAITAESRVELTASVAASSITPVSCQAFASSVKTLALVAPDPKIVVEGCTNVGGPCTLTARSIGEQDLSQWLYSWSGAGPAELATRAISPSLGEGTYTVTVAATNAVSTTISASVTLTLAKPFCSGHAESGNLVIQREIVGRTVAFRPDVFGGYRFQDCDIFAWNFGDGLVSAERTPTHTFAADGTYTITLTVSNNSGADGAIVSAVATRAVVVGNSPPPPPPPPPPPGCSPPPAASNLSLTYYGSSPTCSGAAGGVCQPGETIAFVPAAFGASFQLCHTFSWSFGDGQSSTLQFPSHAYANPGSYTVTWTVSNGIAASPGRTETITIPGLPTTQCVPPSGDLVVNYTGNQSQCSTGGRECTLGEVITFNAMAFRYNFQSCDQFDWNFGDSQTGTGRSTQHAYAGFGPYTVTLRVWNSASATGLQAVPPTLVVFAGSGAKPTLSSLTLPDIIVAGTEVVFTAVTSAPAITRSDWDFGDGSGIFISQGLSAPHKYAVAGNYDIKVSATNASGTSDVITINITVKPPPTTRKRGSKR